MSLSRSPSPRRGGGWASPGLSADISNGKVRAASPSITSIHANADRSGPTWSSAKQRSARVEHGGYPKYESQNSGIWRRFKRNMSLSLPFSEKDKMGRGSPGSLKALLTGDWRDIPRNLLALLSRRRKLVAACLLIVGMIVLWNTTLVYWYRRTAWLGGGAKFVIILGANQGGGVMEWKGAREWAIERDSVRNKKKYAASWGYELEIVDMSTKKRYAHEWRESWEKVDVIRNTMKKYPDAEWFWWLDLNTFIMEPTYSLQSHIFTHLQNTVYRDINVYNPLQIQHPPNGSSGASSFENYLDPVSLSAVGDARPESINLIVPQDCGGFNLGSFFVKRSPWTDRMLDIWWDPVFYEQRHMEWEHKEQDALEYLYINQPWVRPSVAFLPQRKINAFPNGACGDDRGLPKSGKCPKSLTESVLGGPEDPTTECGVQGIHYQEAERDFLVNMAGCEWGRDCWSEMYRYRELSNLLNRTLWAKFKDSIWDLWHRKEIQRKAREKAEREQQEQQEKEKAQT
ncbi:related to MNN10-subunit of mannosyltransferase complex [Ramularia collo-cygni]|uniref:Related to MNN10-subunit of mannosyltransferase complex n=1 Tax=Ramularia collo-cygni TaxID=112498 RepID=A0A2D3VCK0_9PEZI|nr:related to MNN10-subunit of mannosyltransferase complex [Ramularia collo-cygni]CZT24750.1 related to MNN10-subunit of mannosyltransferase complex [Ramularia collo-cygni]